MSDRAELTHHAYGKGGVRVLRVFRDGARHDVWDLDVRVDLEGDFGTSYTSDDNSRVVPTDTMKNTVYVLARRDPGASPEALATTLAGHFRDAFDQVRTAAVTIDVVPWHRAAIGGTPHDHVFALGSAERTRCRVVATTGGERHVEGGLHDLVLMKTTASGFAGFHRAGFTTLADTDDRVLRTSVTARWTYRTGAVTAADDFDARHAAIRGALIEGFASGYSPSVQRTLHEMAERALGACPALAEIHLALPNKHCLLVDLAPFDETNPNEVFLPVEEPYGMIEATLRR